MNIKDINKILVIRFSSLGDIILTTPFLKILRQNFPESQIDFCVKKSYSEILKYNPNINNILEVDDNFKFDELRKLKKKIKEEHYGIVIDLHNNFRTFYLKLFLRFRAKILVFKKYSFKKFLMVNLKINLMKEIPQITQRYINVLKKIININELKISAPEIYTDDISKSRAENIINEINKNADNKLICIIPSTKHFTKTYPDDNFIDLIDRFDKKKYKFILVGEGQDKLVTYKIKSQTGENVFDLCNKLNLLELTELMKKCDLVITGDTGPMHIAEAAGIPIIMLAGSSVKDFGFYPNTKKCNVIEVSGLKCRPCSHIGRKSCPRGHFRCMKEMTPDIVYEEITKLQ